MKHESLVLQWTNPFHSRITSISQYEYYNGNLQLQIYDPDMVEIKTLKVTLPGTDHDVNFPKITLRIDLEENSNWKVKKPPLQVMFTVLYFGFSMETSNQRGSRLR